MLHKDNKSTRRAVALIGVSVLTGFIGVALSAQMGPRRGPDAPPPQGVPGMGQGMEMGMGQPGMGPGMRGRVGMRRGPGMGPFGGPLGPAGIGLRELGLTEAQLEQIKGVVASHRDGSKGTAEALMKARQELRDTVTSGSADEAAIRAKAAEVARHEADAAVSQAKLHSQVFEILTPEQQQKAKELRSAREKRMQEGRDRMRQRMEQRQERRLEQRSDREPGGPEAV